MNVRLDKKRGRALAVAILIAIVAVILALTAGPVWMANASRQAALDQAHERLQRYRQIAARDAERVSSITSANQAQVTSTQILPPSEEQGFVRITLRVRLRGTLPAILQSLYDIETHDVYMFVDNVGLADNLLGRNRAPEAIRPMDAQFDLVAYMPEES
jgi:Tfp pilus assembly protein PilX